MYKSFFIYYSAHGYNWGKLCMAATSAVQLAKFYVLGSPSK